MTPKDAGGVVFENSCVLDFKYCEDRDVSVTSARDLRGTNGRCQHVRLKSHTCFFVARILAAARFPFFHVGNVSVEIDFSFVLVMNKEILLF